MSIEAIKIHSSDNVAVALKNLTKGDLEQSVSLMDDIPQGHKFSLQKIMAGEEIVKYGLPIGVASKDIPAGAHVHTHNCKTQLSGSLEYSYQPNLESIKNFKYEDSNDSFMGFLRPDGQAGIRNEVWIIPTVGCVNSVAAKLVQMNQDLVNGSLEGLYSFPHPFGCSQLGSDHAATREILADLVRHPNAGAVLVLSLGCENNHVEGFKQELGTWDDNRVKFLVCQDSDDEVTEGSKLLGKLADFAKTCQRQEIPVSKLVIGLKCGGSDGLSGITANPTVGRLSDLVISRGGSTILTEIPEVFGAESLLMNRSIDDVVFHLAQSYINNFKTYFTDHGQVVYENPSPGNKVGGITTLEDKSCGCIQKGGSAPLVDVIDYGDPVRKSGLTMLYGPGNDLVSCTALTASGAQLILFTTGRGTPFGAPAPTIKISSNNELYAQKANWMDFNAGTIVDGETIDDAAKRLYQLVLNVASGKILTQTEKNGYREISIFKDGVVL